MAGFRLGTISGAVGALVLGVGVPAAAQQHGGWSLSGGAGFVAQFDEGSVPEGRHSVGVTLLRERGHLISFGLEAGLDRHAVLNQRISGFYSPGPTPRFDETCIDSCQPAVLVYRRVNEAWHVGPIARIQSQTGVIRPWGELGVGLYGLRERYRFQVEDPQGAPLPGDFNSWSDMILAPGAGAGTGFDWFPGSGRVGVGLAARLRLAGRPVHDHISAALTGSLQARVTVR